MAFDRKDSFDDADLKGGLHGGLPFGKRKPPTGRKDRTGQEQIIKLDAVKDHLPTLVDLYKQVKDYTADLNNGIKATAETAGVNASVVKKYVVAKAGENFEEQAKNVRQLALVFELG